MDSFFFRLENLVVDDGFTLVSGGPGLGKSEYLLQGGKWSWGALGVQMARMVVTFFPQLVWFLIINDPFIYRAAGSITSLATRPIVLSMPWAMLGEHGPVGDQGKKTWLLVIWCRFDV